ncbi:hypothetical protein [Bradyrhizobium sp. JYMT SZCCT0428]|uniref:hypothetical protein n=1 Tax=Bradyrhizobium sp. JYMT SZCCT0428 TaxID=2807673 RepID=UPI0028A2D761|nr:hypothetical protein [Bradyrhizobium sp. JYMT SZCCT0428]
MKFSAERPYSEPEKAASKLLKSANATEAIQDGRIHIEKINGPMLFQHGASPTEYKAGLDLAIARGWPLLHESGTYVKFTPAGDGSVCLNAYGPHCERHSSSTFELPEASTVSAAHLCRAQIVRTQQSQ